MPEVSLNSSNKVIGTKQVKRALTRGGVLKVFIAEDAEPHIIRPLMDLCREKNVEVELVPTMVELGKACGIEIGSASAAIVEELSAKGGV